MEALIIECTGVYEKTREDRSILIPGADNLLVQILFRPDLSLEVLFEYAGKKDRDYAVKARIEIPKELVDIMIESGRVQEKIESKKSEFSQLFHCLD